MQCTSKYDKYSHKVYGGVNNNNISLENVTFWRFHHVKTLKLTNTSNGDCKLSRILYRCEITSFLLNVEMWNLVLAKIFLNIQIWKVNNELYKKKDSI